MALRTLRAIEKQAEIATNSERSWVVERGVDKPDMSGVWILTASCHFEVIGKSPVRVSEAKFRFHLVNAKVETEKGSSEPDLPNIPDYGESKTIIDAPDMGSIRPPGEKFQVSPKFESTFIKPEDIEAIKAGDKFLCLYGFIRYRDAFTSSKMRETKFCYVHGRRNPLDSREDQFVVGGPPAYNEVT
jgi:hypothetical protein